MVNPGQFIYPPPNGHGDTLHYNYLDTVIVSWETLAQNVTPTYLSIYYYLNDGHGWKAGYNQSVAVNGSRNVDLNIIEEGYYGQFNLMYWLPDNGGLGKYLSQFFFVEYNSNDEPVIWGSTSSSTASATTTSSFSTATSTLSTTSSTATSTLITTSSTATSTLSTKSSTATSTLLTTSSTATSTVAAGTTAALAAPGIITTSASAPAQTSSSAAEGSQSSSGGLSKGAIAGIAVGAVVAAVALLGIAIFILFRRRSGNKTQIRDSATAHELSKKIKGQHKYENFAELPATAQKVELSSSGMLAELPS